MKYHFSVLILLCVLISCNEKKDSLVDTFPYDYVKSMMKSELIQTNGNIYLIIPINACSPCVNETFKIATEYYNHQRFNVLMYGDYKKHFLPFRDWLDQNNHNFYLDEKSHYKSFGVNLESPYIYFFNENKLHKTVELKLQNIDEIKTYISDFLGN